jgi:hypothetical protein
MSSGFGCKSPSPAEKHSSLALSPCLQGRRLQLRWKLTPLNRPFFLLGLTHDPRFQPRAMVIVTYMVVSKALRYQLSPPVGKIPTCGHNIENYKIFQVKWSHFVRNQLFDLFHENPFMADINFKRPWSTSPWLAIRFFAINPTIGSRRNLASYKAKLLSVRREWTHAPSWSRRFPSGRTSVERNVFGLFHSPRICFHRITSEKKTI